MSDEQIDLFADSYRAGASRTVIVGKDGDRTTREFETFAPKAFAGINDLDQDLADRTILITTAPMSRSLEAVRSDDPELGHLRAQSYRWALLNAWKFAPVGEALGADTALVRTVYPALHGYRGRQFELWLPIEVVMEMLEVPEEDRVAARNYYQRSQTATKAELPPDSLELLQVLLGLVGSGDHGTITSKQILEELNERGSRWTPQKLGRALQGLNVCTDKRRTTERDQRLYDIDWDAVRSAADRYGLQAAASSVEAGDGV